MKLWIVYVCLATILLITIIGVSVVIIRMEKYVLLNNMGRNLFKRMIKPIKERSERSTSLKYKGHRYNRHHVRSNPHVRRYQD